MLHLGYEAPHNIKSLGEIERGRIFFVSLKPSCQSGARTNPRSPTFQAGKNEMNGVLGHLRRLSKQAALATASGPPLQAGSFNHCNSLPTPCPSRIVDCDQ